MKSHIDIAKSVLLAPAAISEQQLEQVLARVLSHRIDSADLYFQQSQSESWFLEDGLVKNATHSIEKGVGIRAVDGEKTGLAYSDDIILPAMLTAADAARSIAQSGGVGAVNILHPVEGHDYYSSASPFGSMSEEQKIELLRQVDVEARKQDPRVLQVMVGLIGSYNTILIVGSDGTLAADVRPLVRLNVTVIAGNQNKREHGFYGGGARTTYDYFLSENRAVAYAHEAVRQALVNLEAIEAPAGNMPVVLGPGWPGVLLHEAVGHGLEGDFNRKQTSAFAGKIGQRVASPLCTVIDDGTLSGRRGSLNVDDEGVLTQRTVLIEKGILKGYMQDKLNARLMGTASTGNGRRESYAALPIPRMTNTFMMAGGHVKEEIIASVDKGLYAVNFDGGEVDITSGKFVFSTSEAYLIEKGRITAPVKGATLIGSGPEVLTKVSMVGGDLALDSGVGICGKEGQSVPVGVGQPTLKIDELTVGGTF